MTSRRDFLRTAAGAASLIGTASLPATARQRGDDYKALVCVILQGGIDAHDCLIPTDPAGYAAWWKARQAMLNAAPEGIRAREALIGLGGQHSFGFAPELAPMAELYARGDLAVVANTGPLIEPVTKRDIVDRSGVIPPRLASHNDQRSVWMTMAPEGARTGWGGRMIDQLRLGADLSSVSINRNNSFVVGQSSPGITLSDGGIKLPFGIGRESVAGSELLPQLMEEHLRGAGVEARGYLEQDVLAAQRLAHDSSVRLAGLLKNEKSGKPVRIKKNRLSEELAMVANLIALRREMGLSRQVFAVQLGRFDTHNNQFAMLPDRQRQLSEALLAFQDTLNAMGVAEQVTTFTVSDFGRTLISNSSGTDHGWGGHHYVMGGAVKGGKVIGSIPPSDVGHDLDWRRGAMIPTLSVEQYGAELGRWFGLDSDQLSGVFPNLGRFDRDAVKLFG